MPNLDEKIGRWRASVEQAMPGRQDAVQELEDHLRDQIETLISNGTTPDAAFDQSVARLGQTGDLAAQFAQVPARNAPSARLIQGLHAVWITAALLNGVALLIYARGSDVSGQPGWSTLMLVHALLLTTGYVSILFLGLFGIGALAVSWNRALSPAETHLFHRGLCRCTITAAFLTAMGLGTGVAWWRQHTRQILDIWPAAFGPVLVLACLGFILWLQQKKSTDTRIQCLLVTLTGIAGFVGWFGTGTGIIPMGAAVITLAIAIGQLVLLLVRPGRGDAQTA